MKPSLYPNAVLTFDGSPVFRVLRRRPQSAFGFQRTWWILENLDLDAPRHESFPEEELMKRLDSGELCIQALKQPQASTQIARQRPVPQSERIFIDLQHLEAAFS